MAKAYLIKPDGSRQETTSEELTTLAELGVITPETELEVQGNVVRADRIKSLAPIFKAAQQNPIPQIPERTLVETPPFEETSKEFPPQSIPVPTTPIVAPAIEKTAAPVRQKVESANDESLLNKARNGSWFFDPKGVSKLARKRLQNTLTYFRILKFFTGIGGISFSLRLYEFLGGGSGFDSSIISISIFIIYIIILVLAGQIPTMILYIIEFLALSREENAIRQELYLEKILNSLSSKEDASK